MTPNVGELLAASAQDTFENAQMWFQYGSGGTTASHPVAVGDALSSAGALDLGVIERVPQTIARLAGSEG